MSGIFFLPFMSDWSQTITEKISENLRGVPEKDLRFFRIEEYLRMLKRVDEFAVNCTECKQARSDIEQHAEIIGQAIRHVGKERRMFDGHSNKLASHMKKKHGFYPPFYFTYSHTFFYSFVASILGFLTSLLFQSIDRWFFIVPAFVLGLLGGQFYGAQKDAKVRNNNKLL